MIDRTDLMNLKKKSYLFISQIILQNGVELMLCLRQNRHISLYFVIATEVTNKMKRGFLQEHNIYFKALFCNRSDSYLISKSLSVLFFCLVIATHRRVLT
jgi:hypothetical protein